MKSSSIPSAGLNPASDTDLDPDALRRLRRFGGEPLLRELVQLFARDAGGRMGEARAGLAAGDAGLVKGTLHTLKSSAAQLGAARLQRLCQEGESFAAVGRLDAVAPLLEFVDAELARAQQWLRAAIGDA